MEDVKKRLEFGNPFLQHQALWKLEGEIEKKAGGGRITVDTTEGPEVKALWEVLCEREQATLTQTAAHVWLHLVVSETADFTYVLHGVLNRVPFAKCLVGVVKALGGLLSLQAVAVQESGQRYTCPYSLRAPAHPFITVLTHRPLSWPLMTSQVEALILHDDVRVQRVSLEILRPFVSFVLLEPSPSHAQQVPLLRLQLQNLLLRLCPRSAACEPWLAFLVDLLPCYQVNTAETVHHLLDHVRLVLHTLCQRHSIITHTANCNNGQDHGKGKSAQLRKTDQDNAAEDSSTCNLLQQLACRATQSALSLLLPAVQQHQLDVLDGLLGSIASAAEQFPQCLSGETRLIQLCHLLMELGLFAPTSVLHLVEQAATTSISQQSSSTSPAAASTTAVAAGMLVLPVLQFMAGSTVPGSTSKSGALAAARQHRQVLKAASAALTALQKILATFQREDIADKAVDTGRRVTTGHGHLLGSEVESQALADLMGVIATDLANTCGWLPSLLRHLRAIKGMESVSWQTTCVVSSLLLLHRHPVVTSLALDVLVEISRLDNTKAPLFLPLLLYSVREETDPETRLVILEHLPLMAQHKLCVPPILKTLQALLTSPKLRALAIRLITSLWQRQDRCFPQLLKAIGEEEVTSPSLNSSSKSSTASLSPDVLLAKAAAVKEICRLRPEQHGADLLAPLSNILQAATDQQGAAPSALAMEGLYYLCEAEVMDIQSAWKVLEKQLTSEKRGVVLVKVCQLLSLVPQLAISSAEYEEFQKESVNRLWRYAQSEQAAVQGAAFRALSHFSVDCFRVSHLPRQVCEELHLQVEMMQQQQQQQQGEDKQADIITVDSLFTFIPGVCYTRLLKTLPHQVLPDYEAFMCKMVEREVEALPRGIYHATNRRHGTSSSSSGTNQDRAISSIPQFLSRSYENTKQPGLRPSLAAALLFCFDPPVEVGRDGRPRKHYVVRHGKLYSDTFSTLLNEVPVQPSEWHRSLLMPQAWQSFMERLCLALIESRGAELDMQVKHGHITADQKEEKTFTAWLFVRDNIVDILKATSKGTPSQQANSVFALTALTVFVTRYAGGLDTEVRQECDRATQHVSHTQWLTTAVDTILSVRDIKYRPRGNLLGICQQRSADDRSTASNLAQATACVCAGTLVPCLLGAPSTSDTQVLRYLLRELSWSLPGARKAPELPVLQLHNGLGLGMVLGKLFQEGFCDMATAQDKRDVSESLKALEEVVLNPTLENRPGSVLGLGLALTGLCQDGKSDSREHIVAMWKKLSSLMDSTPPLDHTYQALCFILACLSGSAFCSNILRTDDVSATLHQMEMAHTNNPQMTGCSLGLGMLCYTLSRMGHPGITTIRQKLTSQWLAALIPSPSSENPVPATVKIAALNGLMALIGSEQSTVVVQAGVSLTSSDVRASEVVEAVNQMVQSDPDLGIQGNAAWMLGHLHLSACSVAENRATVPPNYGYLPEASFIRAIIDLLLEAGRQGLTAVSDEHMKVALAVLQNDVTRVLPPLNWAGVLSPVMRMDYGDECQRLCLTLALSQGASAPTAAMILNSWLTPPLCMSVADSSKRSLFASLPVIIKSVSPAILTTFLQRCCLPTIAEQDLSHGGGSGDPPAPCPQRPLASVLLQGLAAALHVPDPPEAVTAVLYEAVKQAYTALPAAEFSPLLFRGMAECFAEVPDEIFDDIIAEDYAPGTCSLRAFFIGCCLVARGKQPITLMNGLIDSAMNSPQCGGEAVLYSLAHGLWEAVRQRTETAGPMDRLNWLVELLGHTRNIATQAVPLNCPTQPLAKAVEFSVLVVAMAFTLLTSARPSPNLSLDPALLKVKGNEIKARKDGGQWQEDWWMKEPEALPGWSGELKSLFLAQLPMAVLAFERTPWDQLLPKVFDWLLTMSHLSDDLVSADIKQSLTASLLMLRHSSEFRKTSNWTRVLAEV